MTVAATSVEVFNAAGIVVLLYFAAILAAYSSIMAISAMEIRRYTQRRSVAALNRTLRSGRTPGVTICIAAFNEEKTIVGAVRAMLSLEYPRFEIVLANDGSTDGTLRALVEGFDLERVDRPIEQRIETAPVGRVFSSGSANLVVLDKHNGGRSDALNACINAGRNPLVLCVDADSILEGDALLTAVMPFLDRPDEVVGVGGVVRVANGCRIEDGHVTEVRLPRHPLAMFQAVEYLRAFIAARVGWSRMGAVFIISGAFGLFTRKVLIEAGGFARDSIGEDFELCVRLRRGAAGREGGSRLVFVPDPVCWTQAPTNVRDLGGQRSRWQHGLVDTLWRHRRMIGNPRYGATGLVSLPFLLVFELLGAVVESFGYVTVAVGAMLGIIDWGFAAVVLGVAMLTGTSLSLAAVLLEEVAFRRHVRVADVPRLIVYGLFENFGYRQIVLWYRLVGLTTYVRGDRGWGEIERFEFEMRR